MSDPCVSIILTGDTPALQRTEVKRPRLQPGEVLVEILCCTICGSDLHTYEGTRSTPCPTILGHEMVGRVVDLHPEHLTVDFLNRPVNIGDRITWSVAVACQKCEYCRRGLTQKCTSLFKYGHQKLTDENYLSGGLASHCHLVKGTTIFKVPASLPDQIASPANCATATVMAAFRLAGEIKDRSVLILGAGMLGITATAVAKSRGAASVIVSDINPQRVQRGLEFGATHSILVKKDQPLHSEVHHLTQGRGVDFVFDMTGVPDVIESGLEALDIGGTMILVGSVYPARPLQVSAEQVVRRLLKIEGIHNYIDLDLANALNFLERYQHTYPFQKLCDQSYSLEEVTQAFEASGEHHSYRVAVLPQKKS
ncbi:alcohol dehydrogenase catalytic domain-containing protein [Gimesia benthica]|uniref:alcohol dehydrogenase n=1 Tax=Gimesia benthica TaxID=2608982 RepID=A0A6I6ADW2_9PLAN|nr:zinc-binding dehydrogenase [Gimesia benthica]QGQ23575.1 alcohol dehydrogenase catalytic domain-containing protein [Gimesia benthica]